MAKTDDALIVFEGVKKAFGPKEVYRQLDLQVYEGEALTIIGGSGQGKSVMLKMLIGLLAADDGDIRFDGESIIGYDATQWAALRKQVQLLFQGAALFDAMNVYDNVAYGLQDEPGLSRSEIDTRVREALDAVGLPGREEQWPTELSSGMKKRVGLARSIALRPRVLLYDEPTTGLDPVTIGRITDLIVKLQSSLNVTSVVVTHDMPAAFAISDRIAMIQNGYVIFEGTPLQLVEESNPHVYEFVRGLAEDPAGASEAGP